MRPCLTPWITPFFQLLKISQSLLPPVALSVLLLCLMPLLTWPLTHRSQAWASSFGPPPSLDSQLQEARAVVVGTIRSQSAEYGLNAEGKERLYSYWQLELQESPLKGDAAASPQLTLRELGGEKAGVQYRVPGSAEFTLGERVLVLLSAKTADGAYPVLGMAQGKFPLLRDSSGQDWIEVPEKDGGARRLSLAAVRTLLLTPAESPLPSSPQALPAATKPPSPVPPTPLPTAAPLPAGEDDPTTTAGKDDSSRPVLLLTLMGLALLGAFLLFLRFLLPR